MDCNTNLKLPHMKKSDRKVCGQLRIMPKMKLYTLHVF